MTVIEKNKKLIERYPFLLPRNRFTGEIMEGYDYSYTELDDMPDGWRIAFALEMCEELLSILTEGDCVADYRIIQIKEKFGELRWYASAVPRNILDKYNAFICKYEELSRKTCIQCGAKATKVSKGWISPWCDKCATKKHENYIDIIEWRW